MTNQHSASPRAPQTHRLATALAALLLAASACGDLDERDLDPPSVKALTRWDSTHVLALRTYKKNAALVDLATGKQTGELALGRYYDDIHALGEGWFLALHNQFIERVRSDGHVDEPSTIAGTIFGGIAVSGDRNTFAYSEYDEPTKGSLFVRSLQDGVTRSSPSGKFGNLSNDLSDGFALSRDGKLIAFTEANVGFARTTEPASTLGTCELSSLAPPAPANTLAFSPVADQLAVGTLSGELEIFDLSDPTSCRSLRAMSRSSPDTEVTLVRYSPNGALLAVATRTPLASATATNIAYALNVRLVDATAGTSLRELPIYSHDPAPGESVTSTPLITDLLWSETGDQVTIAVSSSDLQHWDTTTGKLLWKLKL